MENGNKTENEQENFEVENTQDTIDAIGTNTEGDNSGADPQSQEKDEESNHSEGDDPKDGKEESKTGDEEKKPKRKSRAQRRIERVTRENADLKKKLAEKEGNTSDEPGEELNIDDFESYDDYIDALEKADKRESKADKPKEEDKASEDPERKEDIQDMFEDGKEVYEDFEELIMSNDLALTQEILSDVLESEKPSEVAYYLATHKDKTREIAGMSARKRAKALIKIELDLETKPNVVKKKKTSSAPDPINPVDGNSSKPKSLNDDDLSYEEYEAEFNRSKKKSTGWL